MAIIYPFPPYSGYTWNTPIVPKLYWDVYSQEQRIKALCMEYAKLIAYNSDLADTLNSYIEIVNTLQEQIPELVNEDVKQEIQELVTSGEFAEMVQEAIDKIAADIDAEVTVLKGDLADETTNRVNADNDLSLRIDTLKTDVSGDIQDLEESIKPTFQYDIANTQNGYEFLQFDGEKTYRKYLAMGGFQNGFPPHGMINPLPLFYIASTYRTATNLVYGNEYTATNVNENYDGWEPAFNHPASGGNFNIDCTTFVLLAISRIIYNGSTYKSTSGNIFRSDYVIDFFDQVTREYMNYEYRLVGEDPASQPEHRRLLASEFALMLDDMGMLVKFPTLSAAALSSKVNPGDVIFYSNASDESHYMGIGHCSIVVYSNLNTGDVVVIEASTPRTGTYNNAVVYHKLTETEISQIKYKMTPPEININGGFDNLLTFMGPISSTDLTASTSQSKSTATYPGTLILKAGSASTVFNLTFDFKDDNATDIDASMTLAANMAYRMFVHRHEVPRRIRRYPLRRHRQRVPAPHQRDRTERGIPRAQVVQLLVPRSASQHAGRQNEQIVGRIPHPFQNERGRLHPDGIPLFLPAVPLQEVSHLFGRQPRQRGERI